MLITDDEALPVFLEVQRIRETLDRYARVPNVVPASLDDIEEAIATEYGYTIEKRTWSFKSDLVRGLIRIYHRPDGKFAQTVVDDDLSQRQIRYVQTKELAHIPLCHLENCTKDPTMIIEHFVQDGVRVGDVPPGMLLDIKNEHLADFAAQELVFPHELRQAAAARIADPDSTETVQSTADWLGIPEHVVELVLSDRYLSFANHVWARVALRAVA